MSPNTDSPTVITKPKTWLERFMAALDPDFPSAVISGPEFLIGDPAAYGKETLRPDFVVADDQNFTGGAK